MNERPQPGSQRRKKILLILWLLAPLAAVLMLFLFVDRSKGRPDPERMRAVPAGPTRDAP